MSTIVGRHATRDLHVSASDRQCIRHVQRKFKAHLRYDRVFRDARHATYREALEAHHEHQGLVQEFRL